MPIVILLLVAILITLLHGWESAGTVAAVAAYVLWVSAIVLSPVALWFWLHAWHHKRQEAQRQDSGRP